MSYDPARPSKAPQGETPPASRNWPKADRPDPPDEDAFDIWLRLGLRRAFVAVVAEPIPENLLRMIEEDRAGRDRSGGSGE